MICLTMEPHSEHAFRWAIDNLIKQNDKVCLLTVIEPKWHSFFTCGFGASAGPSFSSQSSYEVSEEQADIAYRHLVQACKSWLATKERELLVKFPLLLTDTLVVADNCNVNDPNEPCRFPTNAVDVKERIVESTLQLKPDVMVMGSKSQGKLRRAFLGSVSDYCVHHCDCPVLIIKE